jgi:hypothetical protein
VAKHFRAEAGQVPEFNSASIQPLNRPVRVTGKSITAGGNHPLRTLNYESAARKGGIQNMTDQAECDCLPAGMPSIETLEKAANAFLYGGIQPAANKRSRDYQDTRGNYCPCGVLKPVATGKCPYCDTDDTITAYAITVGRKRARRAQKSI